MSKKEFIEAINQPGPVFANVKLTEGDCWYVQVVKSHLLLTIASHPADTRYSVKVRDDALYID
jgi:hypothetical protein